MRAPRTGNAGGGVTSRSRAVGHNRRMVIADLVPRRLALGGRLPNRIEDLIGAVKGVILLPRNLSWPGMREGDVSDDCGPSSLYLLILAPGPRKCLGQIVSCPLLR